MWRYLLIMVPRNWIKKKDDEYMDYIAEMADGMAEMMREEDRCT